MAVKPVFKAMRCLATFWGVGGRLRCPSNACIPGDGCYCRTYDLTSGRRRYDVCNVIVTEASGTRSWLCSVCWRLLLYTSDLRWMMCGFITAFAWEKILWQNKIQLAVRTKGWKTGTRTNAYLNFGYIMRLFYTGHLRFPLTIFKCLCLKPCREF